MIEQSRDVSWNVSTSVNGLSFSCPAHQTPRRDVPPERLYNCVECRKIVKIPLNRQQYPLGVGFLTRAFLRQMRMVEV
jgi:hypothetical protein